ncbi:unnamed protein product [Durusdinium trenchii]|uniref:C3H1-type domain-containing protein n=1 Tax=Durusdinium trenchii TaxID=1381693 RepID=A0ABP0T2H0_9DINO
MAHVLSLRYHNSFIDVEEPVAPLLRRASSAPVMDRVAPWGANKNEEDQFLYVQALSKKLQQKWQSVSGVMCMPPEQMQLDSIPSFGSLGHPDVCHRPCMYFQAGLCRNGSACTYCHLSHDEKQVKLDKKQRVLMQHISYKELVVLTLPFVRQRIQEMTVDASELLFLLETEAADANLPVVPLREGRNLSRVLARMNLSRLIGLVQHKISSQSDPEKANLSESLDVALESIRNHFILKE